MTRTIYKYELLIQDEVIVELPRFANVLTVQVQNGKLQLWVITPQPTEETQPRTFRIIGTGHPILENKGLHYISTVQLEMGLIVYHIFEKL